MFFRGLLFIIFIFALTAVFSSCVPPAALANRVYWISAVIYLLPKEKIKRVFSAAGVIETKSCSENIESHSALSQFQPRRRGIEFPSPLGDLLAH